MKKLTFGLVVLAALAAAPVQAQKRGGPPPPTPEEMEQKRDAAQLDQQYKNALKRTSTDATTPARVDPWANMRGTDNTKR